MKKAVLGALLVFGLVVAVAGAQNWPAATQRPAPRFSRPAKPV